MDTKIPKIFKWLYKVVLRDLLIKAIDNPNTEWDDKLIAWLDGLFEYNLTHGI